MAEPLLKVRGLKKYFPARREKLFAPRRFVRAVDNVSFDIGEGEILGLVGESGSGKTTVGRAILNLSEPTGGSAFFAGRELFDAEKGRRMSAKDMGELRRSMQMIFQDPYASLDPRMNVERTITEGMVRYGLISRAQISESALRLAEECGLSEDCLKKFPHQFSGGQRQRIGIARAISLEPRLIVCDEPTAALDVSVQSQILNLMLRLRSSRGMSYLFITHNLGIARHFCDRICVMYLGTIVETAPASVLFSGCAHPYTAALLEATPSVKSPKRDRRELITGEIPSPYSPPQGCKFHPRCKHATQRCRCEEPQLRPVGEGHSAACHIGLLSEVKA